MKHRSLGVHYFIRAGLLSFFAYYILHLVRTDQLVIYIGPRMQLYVKLAALGFYLLAVAQIYLAFRTWWGDRINAKACGCGNCATVPSSIVGKGVFYSLFAIPLLLSLCLPDTALSSSLVDKKGINLTGTVNARANTASTGGAEAASPKPAPTPIAASSASAEAPQAPSAALDSTRQQALNSADPLEALFPHDEFSGDLAKLAKKLYSKDSISIQEKGFMETVSSIDFYMNNFVGKKVDMSGFVYRDDGMKDNQFVVARFAVQCCSADAAPFGFMVESALGKDLKKDTWVKITGTLGKTTYNDNEILKVDAAKIERISAPKTPYIYPDWDYFNTEP